MQSLNVMRKELSNEKETKKSYKEICTSFVCSPVLHYRCCISCIWHQGYSMYRDAVTAYPIPQMVSSIQSRENFVEYEELPTIYIDAVISVEDKRFESHCGVDFIAIGRAVWNDIKAMSFVEGGSTITQQIAKINTIRRKRSSKENLQRYSQL